MSSVNNVQPPVVLQHQCRCRRRPGLFTLLFQAAALYVVLVFAGGTLINTPSPVAQEVGKLIHAVTFIEPTIAWAKSNEFDSVAGGLETLANGFPVRKFIS